MFPNSPNGPVVYQPGFRHDLVFVKTQAVGQNLLQPWVHILWDVTVLFTDHVFDRCQDVADLDVTVLTAAIPSPGGPEVVAEIDCELVFEFQRDLDKFQSHAAQSSNAASNRRPLGAKSTFLQNWAASAAPASRSMPESSHSTDSGASCG